MSQERRDVRFEGTSDIQGLEVLGGWANLRDHFEIGMAPSEGGEPDSRSGYTLYDSAERTR